MHTVKSQVFSFPKRELSFIFSVINQHLPGDINTNVSMILIHKFYVYSFNSMDVMASVMFTYFCLKFIDMPCLHVYKYLMLTFLIQKDQGPVPCIDVSCVGRCCAAYIVLCCF